MNSFFGIGFMELFFIAVLALIVLGPERLPGAIRELAKHARTIRNLSNELTSQFSEELQALDEINPQKILRELTEDPAEEKKKSTTKAASTSPAAKSSTGTTKPASASKTTATAKSSEAKAATGDGRTNGTNASTNPQSTPEPADGAEAETAQSESEAHDTTPTSPPETETENSILPPEMQSTAEAAPKPADEAPAAAESTPIETALGSANGTGAASNGLPDKPEDAA
jgi:sec-independent protein translocase protein TatB